jgi:hypothetical protein
VKPYKWIRPLFPNVIAAIIASNQFAFVVAPL